MAEYNNLWRRLLQLTPKLFTAYETVKTTILLYRSLLQIWGKQEYKLQPQVMMMVCTQ